MNENKKNIMKLTEDDIVGLSNIEKRINFLNNYQSWGVWLNIDQIGVKIYKAVLPDGSVIYVTEFSLNETYGRQYVSAAFRYTEINENYQNYTDSESAVVERLKDMKVKIMKERRSKNEES